MGGNLSGVGTKGTYLINVYKGTVQNLKPMNSFRKQHISSRSWTNKFYVFNDTCEMFEDWDIGWSNCKVENMDHFKPDFYKNFSYTQLNPVVYHSEEFSTSERSILNEYSNYIFGTDIQPCIIEIDPEMEVYSHPVPMNLHLKAYQGIVRLGYGVILVTGGINSARTRATSKTYLYDMSDIKNEILRVEDMSEKRYSFSIIYLHGLVYVIGGQTIDHETNQSIILNSCEKFDPEKTNWSPVADLNIDRCEMMAFNYGGKIYIAGGYTNKGRTNSIETYNVKKDKWELLEMRIPICLSAAGVFTRPDMVFIIGGMKESGEYLDSVYGLDMNLSIVRSFKRLQCCRVFPKILQIENDIVVLGGNEKQNYIGELIKSTAFSGFDVSFLSKDLRDIASWDNFIKEFTLI